MAVPNDPKDPNALTDDDQKVIDSVQIIDEDDDKAEEGKQAAKPTVIAEDDDADAASSEDGGEDADEPERTARTDDDREAIRKQRREKRRRERAERHELRAKVQAQENAINELHGKLAVIQKKAVEGDIAGLNSAIENARAAYNQSKMDLAQAVKDGNGELAVRAQETSVEARLALEKFQSIKARITNEPVDGRVPSNPAPATPLNPRIRELGERWKSENSWYDDPDAADDAALIDAIESRLMASGVDPRTSAYWEKLTERARQVVPHRFRDSEDDPPRRDNGQTRRAVPPGPRGTGRDTSRSETNAPARITREQRNAAEEAAGGDQKKLARLIRRYQDYNAQNPPGGR